MGARRTIFALAKNPRRSSADELPPAGGALLAPIHAGAITLRRTPDHRQSSSPRRSPLPRSCLLAAVAPVLVVALYPAASPRLLDHADFGGVASAHRQVLRIAAATAFVTGRSRWRSRCSRSSRAARLHLYMFGLIYSSAANARQAPSSTFTLPTAPPAARAATASTRSSRQPSQQPAYMAPEILALGQPPRLPTGRTSAAVDVLHEIMFLRSARDASIVCSADCAIDTS